MFKFNLIQNNCVEIKKIVLVIFLNTLEEKLRTIFLSQKRNTSVHGKLVESFICDTSDTLWMGYDTQRDSYAKVISENVVIWFVTHSSSKARELGNEWTNRRPSRCANGDAFCETSINRHVARSLNASIKTRDSE